MTRERLEYIVLLLVGVICGGFVGVIGLRYVLPLVLPFLIAWLTAMLARSPSERLAARMKLPAKAVRLFISLLFVIVIFGALFIGAWQGMGALWRFLVDMGESGMYDTILSFISTPFSSLGLAPELAGKLEEAFANMLTSALGIVAGAVTGWVSALPGALFFLLVTVVSLIYFSLDLERINAFVRSILPSRALSRLLSLRRRFSEVCKRYVRSYFILMLITFAIMLAGLLILGIKHAFIIAALIALLDILPIIGVGTVLVPWSVFELVLGDVGLGIGLAVLFVAHTVVRELIEPKIVGKSLNMHPILTLALLYVGYSLLGLTGLLLVPVVALIISVVLDGGAHRASQ